MVSVVAIVLTLATVVYLLRRRIEIGHAMFAGCIVLQISTLSSPESFGKAVLNVMQSTSTWEILIALYLVMCLEFQLRTSGLLDAVMTAARARQFSDKFLLAGMPAFLGLLPSLGGALFSAPMVQNASSRYEMSPEQKATTNYWFRHVWECSNPILPGLLLLGQITGIALGDLVMSMAWFSVAAIAVGWAVFLAPVKEKPMRFINNEINDASPDYDVKCQIGGLKAVSMTIGPILVNIFLVVVFRWPASISMASVVAFMMLLLRQSAVSMKSMLIRALDRKLLWGVGTILLFQQVLKETDALAGVVSLFQASQVPVVYIGAVLTFVSGMLTGTSTGFVAVAMPVLSTLAPGDLTVVVVAYVMGTLGHMTSPLHLCFLVSIEYFKADFMRAIRPVIEIEAIMAALLIVWVWA